MDGATLIDIHFDFVDVTVLAFPFFAVVIICVISALEFLDKASLWPSVDLWQQPIKDKIIHHI